MSEVVPPSSGEPIEVIIVNGASSTGKSTLAAALQEVLEETWLVFGIDTLIGALGLPLLEMHDDVIIGEHPRAHHVRHGGIRFDADGEITVGPEFRRLEAAWLNGLSSICDSGVRLILDEVFLDGVHSQDRFRRAFEGRRILWVGVTCDVDVATQRERDRGDRVVGASAIQSHRVHDGVHYDFVVDTTSDSAEEIAEQIAQHVRAMTS